MLGIGKKQKSVWQWGLCGKHPVARDYLRMRVNGPMMEAFENWVEKGYRNLSGDKSGFRNMHSWRFWAKGAGKSGIVCGLIRDSSDSIGRPFPLMILGCGALDDWTQDWHLLPNTLDQVWNQMEQCVSRQIESVAGIERMILQIKSPDQYPVETGNTLSPEAMPEPNAVLKHLNTLASAQALWIPLTENKRQTPFQWACAWLAGLKNSGQPSPQAMFIGGTMAAPNLVILSRSLRTDDFQQLWETPAALSAQIGER